jgi:diguanylate cyclase (GGDEF)-like protein
VSAAARPGIAQLAVLFALYLLGGKLGMALTVMPEGLAILWLPNAVVLAALIRFEARGYLAIAATAMAAEIAVGWAQFSLLESALFGVVNVGESTLVFLLLRRFGFNASFVEPVDTLKFVLAGPLVGALAAAFAGASVYSAFRGAEAGYLEFVRIWWFGDALGLLVLTPVLLGFAPFGAAGAASRRPRVADLAVWAAAAAALIVYWLAPEGRGVRAYFGPMLVLPFVLFIAARPSQRWTAAAVALAAVTLAAAVTRGRPPFGALPPRDAVILAQEFIFIMSLVALGLSALLARFRALNEQLEERVAARTAELQHANARLSELASHDELTGLYNRRGLFELAQREFARARRTGRSLALVMADLDHFKEVNDRYGHLAGDEVLKRCAAAHAKLARASDLCGRFGGEEFLLLAPETDLDGAKALAERIRQSLRELGRGGIAVTASFGVTVMGEVDRSFDDVLKRADDALYRAKQAGRDRVVVS